MPVLSLSRKQQFGHKNDLLGCALMALIFTHVNDPFAFLAGNFYLGLLGLNFFAVSTGWFLAKRLGLKGKSWWWSIGLLPLVIALNEVLCFFLLPEYFFSVSELFTIVLPFAFVLVFTVHFYYYRLAGGKMAQRNQLDLPLEFSPEAQLVRKNETAILVNTAKGEVRLLVDELLAIHLVSHKTLLYCTDREAISVVDSMSQLVQQLPIPADFYPVNRRCQARREAITGYKTLSDGRLSVDLSGGSTTLSKNKAADFKRWWKAD